MALLLDSPVGGGLGERGGLELYPMEERDRLDTPLGANEDPILPSACSLWEESSTLMKMPASSDTCTEDGRFSLSPEASRLPPDCLRTTPYQ